MKRYTIQIEIEEGSDEFWEGLEESGKTGCDELLESVGLALETIGFFVSPKLIKYENQ